MTLSFIPVACSVMPYVYVYTNCFTLINPGLSELQNVMNKIRKKAMAEHFYTIQTLHQNPDLQIYLIVLTWMTGHFRE